MALERGFRRIVLVLSVVALGAGLFFTALLAGAWSWSVHLDRQRETALGAEGCPAENDPLPAEVAVRPLSTGRWRVTIPERGYTSSYVVTADRELSSEDVVRAATAPGRDSGIILWRRLPAPGIEVTDCILKRTSMAADQRKGPSDRLIMWWMERPGVLLSMAPLPLFLLGSVDKHPWLFVPGTLFPALVLTAVLAAVPWGLFYLIRWIARGFTGRDGR